VRSWFADDTDVGIWNISVWIITQNVLPGIAYFAQNSVPIILADATEASYDRVILLHVLDRR
jgi:hypothetical protein